MTEPKTPQRANANEGGRMTTIGQPHRTIEVVPLHQPVPEPHEPTIAPPVEEPNLVPVGPDKEDE
jgi:hypothetical protein